MTAASDNRTPPRDGRPAGREARLGQALRANLQRRKAQARARAEGPDDATDGSDDAPDTTEGKD